MSSGFLILIAVFVIFLLLYFQGAKHKEQPTRLRMKAGASPQGSGGATPAAMDPVTPMSLNVIFNYNGHSFDAYETLGVPAGSSWNDVRQAFERSIEASTDEGAKEFYLAAFNAIKSKQQF